MSHDQESAFADDQVRQAGLLGDGKSLRVSCAFKSNNTYRRPSRSFWRRCDGRGTHATPSGLIKRVVVWSLSPFITHSSRSTILADLSLLALECMGIDEPDRSNIRRRGAPPVTHLSASTVADYVPDDYERGRYYNGIAGCQHDRPYLVYRSDFATNVFPKHKPGASWPYIPTKSLRGVYDTPLNAVWDTVLPRIGDLVISRGIRCSSIDPVRFFTHAYQGAENTEDEEARLGPAVVWVGVWPGTTSPDTAHNVSQSILAILLESGVTDVVVEWREAVLQRLVGPPLLRRVRVRDDGDPSLRARRFLMPLLGLSLAGAGTEEDDGEGTLTLWFHENKDKDGEPSDKVFGVSNCHVLHQNTAAEYEHQRDVRCDYVRACGVRRFQRGIDEIKAAISCHARDAYHCAEGLAELEVENQDEEVKGEEDKSEEVKHDKSKREESIRRRRLRLDNARRAIDALEALYVEIKRDWSDLTLERNIGHLQYAAKMTADNQAGGSCYTSDWAAFVAAEAKVQAGFEGNAIDLVRFNPPHPRYRRHVYTARNPTPQYGSIDRAIELAHLFHPGGFEIGPTSEFPMPIDGMLRVTECATKDELASPSVRDKEGERCVMVGKVGSATDLTVGRYAGLESLIFHANELTGELEPSIELAIYDEDDGTEFPFSAKGDSGALVWDVVGGHARIVGQVHSGSNVGGATENHVTYCTPGWFLLSEIRKRFPYADFYRKTW